MQLRNKKLHDNVTVDVDAAVGTVAENPSVGERKKGDLADLFAFGDQFGPGQWCRFGIGNERQALIQRMQGAAVPP